MSRRLIAWLAGGLAVLALAGVVFAPSSTGSNDYAVDVVFDDARGLVGGQLVQIAGARVGKITDVSVTPDYKARVHMKVDSRFAPFRKNARCEIKSQGLIAENYVACDPGTPRSPELKGRDGEPPTVPVGRTTQPVSLTDLFEVWNTPTTDRLEVLLSALGMSTAGRGEDLNEVLRRANPALAQARRTVRILHRQRRDLADTVEETDRIAAALARRPREVESLVKHSGRVAVRTAERRDQLAAGLRRLPPLLAEAPPALRRVDEVMEAGQPLADQLIEGAPAINRASLALPELEEAAAPTLRKLGPVLRAGAITARRTVPLARVMSEYAKNSLPTAKTAGQMFPTLEERGFDDNLLGFLYNATLATARYDDTSHVLPAHVSISTCSVYAMTPTPACGGGAQSSSREDRDRGPRAGINRPRTRSRAEQPRAEQPRSDAPATEAPRSEAPTSGPAPTDGPVPLPQLPKEVPPVDRLLDFLLR